MICEPGLIYTSSRQSLCLHEALATAAKRSKLAKRVSFLLQARQLCLPAPQSDLAQEMTKDPYNFDFLTMTEGYYEKELKDALMNNISDFLAGTWQRVCLCAKKGQCSSTVRSE